MKLIARFFCFCLFSMSVVASALDQSGVGVRYYGYYLSGNYIPEISDHCNLTHQYLHVDQFTTTYQEAINRNMKMMVDLSQVFFNGDNSS